MTDATIDSVTAAKRVAKLFFISLFVGIAAGLATWIFIAADHYGVALLWEDLPHLLPAGVPAWVAPVVAVAVATLAATLVVAIAKGRPFDMGSAEAEYDGAGRMSTGTCSPARCSRCSRCSRARQ